MAARVTAWTAAAAVTAGTVAAAVAGAAGHPHIHPHPTTIFHSPTMPYPCLFHFYLFIILLVIS
jgi:hypothetical protein